jgi:hypothetical protein
MLGHCLPSDDELEQQHLVAHYIVEGRKVRIAIKDLSQGRLRRMPAKPPKPGSKSGPSTNSPIMKLSSWHIRPPERGRTDQPADSRLNFRPEPTLRVKQRDRLLRQNGR